MKKIRPHFQYDGWSVIARDESNEPSFIALSHVYERFEVEEINEKLKRLENPMYMKVIRKGELIHVKNLERERIWFPYKKIRAWTGVPLYINNQLFGVLNFDFFRYKKLKLKERLFLESFVKNFRKYSIDFHVLREIIEDSSKDPLTGLRNRQYLESLCNQENEKLTFVFCDLNKFKQINDTYGHRIGDEVLKIIARRIRNVLKSSDEIVRYGGDEFVIVTKTVNENVIRDLINRVKKAVSGYKINIEGLEIFLNISCGYAIYPDDGEDLWEILHVADLRMYEDKGEIK
ncbi:sensor domain-containing diguanylate cyclase [Thermosipho ferrireducens]|uniref:Sensor domain-containing diguanylate cyclase n=2 Tax=Thermosipho ferrireducens TaxID=2571116 RepID=A0ABX7S8G5_9BACT|nr:sensor domain-containing diguanylate cyclase [Thermosipho ferrireducens]